jgi:integrase/recombinase XerD
MHEIDWTWCPHVAAHEITCNFLISQAKLQKARNTLEAYARDLDDLLDAFADLSFHEVIEADSGQLESYIDGLYNRAPKQGASSLPNITRMTRTRLALATIHRRVGTARRFYQWLIDRRLRLDLINPVPRGAKGVRRGPVPTPRQEPWTPDDDVWERILRHFLEHESLRNQVLLLVCYDGALRRQECLRLRVDDIDHQSLTMKVRAETTKNGKERFVVLSPVTYQKLQQYITRERRRLIEGYGGDANGFLFLSESHRNPGQPISVWTFQDVVKKVRRLVGAPRFTPHKLRHLMLTDLIRGGMALEEVGYYGGHASLDTTNLYVHQKRATVARHIRRATRWRDERMKQLIEETLPHA